MREHGDRGRTADRPADVPPRGWKDILIRTYRSISEDRVLALAAGVTYYVLLALFVGIAALVSIYGLIWARSSWIANPGVMSLSAADVTAISGVAARAVEGR
jgi:uncharacterized BrkB/YihY/UPF0761 family membrane protein